jgi:hypothetical protein
MYFILGNIIDELKYEENGKIIESDVCQQGEY